MHVRSPEERWSYNKLLTSFLQLRRMPRNRLAFMILSIVVHGSLLSLWLTATQYSTRSFREIEGQLVPPTTGALKLPHWRATVDCSAFSPDCLVHGKTTNRYHKYPFPPTSTDDFQIMKLTEIPTQWKRAIKQSIAENITKHNGEEQSHYAYPHEASQTYQQKCLDFITQDTMQQLHKLLREHVRPEPATKMVAFTVADIHYAQDMIHDIFQSFETTIGFKRQSFFMVAIDQATAELACKYNYPVILWKADDENLKDAVANTKLLLSYELAKLGQPFFFSEMDVFWIQSPIPSLVAFMTNTKHEIIFSTHQNNVRKPNIGVYAAKANEKTIEYFSSCIQILQEKPSTHDQFVMTQVRDLYAAKVKREPFQFSPHFVPQTPIPTMPEVNHPFLSASWSPHEVVADERPVPTDTTLAIHPLSGAPLMNPYGKKMIAKELGAWYGFTSDSSPSANTHLQGGYYHRTSDYRRYIWLDGPLGNTHSLVDLDRYHDKNLLEWTMATLFAIARRTRRTLVLPKVINANSDAGIYFLWTIMDHSQLEGMVEIRETNFPSNPKSWKSPVVPYSDVATTALLRKTTMLYAKVSHDGGVSHFVRKGWDFKSLGDSDRLDAWVGALQGEKEIDSAELLLINLDYIDSQYLSKLAKQAHLQSSQGADIKFGLFEKEIFEMKGLLRWCHDKGYRATASKASASHFCYGRGKPSQ